jgi:hypothetical protein
VTITTLLIAVVIVWYVLIGLGVISSGFLHNYQ